MSKPEGKLGVASPGVAGPERTQKGPFRVRHLIGHQGTRYEVRAARTCSFLGYCWDTASCLSERTQKGLIAVPLWRPLTRRHDLSQVDQAHAAQLEVELLKGRMVIKRWLQQRATR